MTNENQERANRARQALAEYINDDPHGGAAQHVSDLLGDLRHYCDAMRIDFADCDRLGHMHYRDELGAARRGKP